jgi:hypothetical protein
VENIVAISPSALFTSLKQDLLGQGLPTEGGLWPGMTISEAAASSLVDSLIKKWEHDTTDAADKAALYKFLLSNELCKNWSLPSQFDSKTECLLNGFKQAVDSFWFYKGYALTDDLRDLFYEARLGPGANIQSRGGSFYHKLFASPLTCSDPSLYYWYSYCARKDPEWSNAENIRIENYGTPRTVKGSKLSFVPKNDKISRCICTEPTLNTFFQLGLGEILEHRLKSRFNIDLSSQQFKNRDLARLGSITDGLSTIDLSSASDSISLKMLEWALPPDMLRLLLKLRTPCTEVEGLGTVELHMVSTMGNGYTFPLQTMLFACAVVACMHFRGIPERRNRSDSLWGVYGDDIICPREITEDVIHLLALLGFRVNDDKTFVQGPFRESCGSDFFLGTDIRGVYVKKLKRVTDFYVAINLLHRFQTRHGISLENTMRLLFSRFGRKRKPCFVPPWENVDCGIQVPHSVAKKFLRNESPNFWKYKAMRPRMPKIRVFMEHIVVPKSAKRLIYNPSGLFVSFLQRSVQGASPPRNRWESGELEHVEVSRKGDINGMCGVIGVRMDTVNYTPERCVTSMWHTIGCPGRDTEYYGLDWGRWETTVEESIDLLALA